CARAPLPKVRAVVLLSEDGGFAVKAGFPPEDMFDDAIARQGSPGTRPKTVADRRGRSALNGQARQHDLARPWAGGQQIVMTGAASLTHKAAVN
ncbi:MAG: hypothetical protein ACREDV_07795, partial [Methylocella sp.]